VKRTSVTTSCATPRRYCSTKEREPIPTKIGADEVARIRTVATPRGNQSPGALPRSTLSEVTAWDRDANVSASVVK
jgi:hypothetical protein